MAVENRSHETLITLNGTGNGIDPARSSGYRQQRRTMCQGLLGFWFLLGVKGGDLAAQSNDQPFPPHRIVGNVYYVGSESLASYLITTSAGHILINSSFEETVPLIQASVEQLKFRFQDVKILLTSHAHSDHVAGNALVKRLTGARVLVMKGDENLVRTGGKGDFQYESVWEPCPVDEVLRDGQEVKLGDAVLVAHRTPGHTKGCTTWTLRVSEGGKLHDVVIIGSPNVNPGYRLVGNSKYPTISDDFARTFQILKSLPCDVFLGAHGDYYAMQEKYAQLQKGAAGNPFIDPQGYRQYVALKEKAFQDELARQEKTGR
jgi:metallo-beta-lactamase class B